MIASRKCVLWIGISLSFLPLLHAQYSDKDKKKMGEIAQRPEIQTAIAKRWASTQRADMAFAYNINRSIQMAHLAPDAFAEYRTKYGEMYDNPALAQYVTLIGQRLVPKTSNNLYAFRILLDPVPRAESISTGTVYISTGLVALLDNEAQLTYVLGHEIAHIEKAHQYERIRNSILETKLSEDKEADVNKKKAIFSAITAVAGAGIGAAAGGTGSAALAGALLGAGGGLLASQFIFRNRFEPTDWNTTEEDEADNLGLKYMLEQQFDAREVPRLLARLDHGATQDARIGLGFVGNSKRVKERIAHMQTELAGEYKGIIEDRLKSGGLKGSSAQFSLLMASLKRDNGIVAMDYDLFAMAKDNLTDAVALRSDDPRAQGYLGRLLATTAQTPADRKEALEHIRLAVHYDSLRGAYPEPYLDAAVMLMGDNELNLVIEDKTLDKDAGAQQLLKRYIALYQREHAGTLPYNVHILYDYLSRTGDAAFYLPPAAAITTRTSGALTVSNSLQNSIPNASTAAQISMAAAGASAAPATLPVSQPITPAVQHVPARKPR